MHSFFLNLNKSGLALLVCLFCLSCAGCASPEASGFVWTDPQGAALKFSQSSGFPEGAEGHFDARHSSNRYVLKTPISLSSPLPSKAGALELDLRLPAGTQSALLALSLSARADGRQPFFEARLGLSGPETRFVIPLPSGEADAPAGLASLSIQLVQNDDRKSADSAADPIGPAGKTQADSSAAELHALRFVPLFRGIAIDADGPRISAGFSSVSNRAGGHAETLLSIKTPFRGFLSAEAETTASGGTASADGSAVPDRAAGQAVPALVIRYGAGAAGFELRSGGRKLYSLRARPQGASVILPQTLFPAGIEEISLVYGASEPLPDFSVQSVDSDSAELSDLGRILKSPAGGTDFELYRWDIIPSVLVFDFKNYDRQDAYLKRLAFFVEKAGYKGRLAPDSQIKNLHGWNAHDYRAEDLARFFEKARAASFRLDPEEEELRNILVKRGIILEQNGSYVPGAGAIVSITHESEGYLRALFMNHEISHAVFFTDPDYRAFVQQLWSSMSQDEKWFWYAYFRWMVYDTSDSYLMANEFQAYLVQQTVGGAEHYFTENLADRLAEKHPELKDKIDTYMKNYGGQFAVRARAVDAWLSRKYGIGAGRSYFFW